MFFYGTFETATLKNEDIWYFTEERAENWENKNKKKKGYLEGMDQIRNNPDIAIVQVSYNLIFFFIIMIYLVYHTSYI